jgi:hypothetical protein
MSVAVPEPRQGGNDPSGFFALLEREHGAETLLGWVRDWVFYSDVLWDEREQCRLDQYLLERASMAADDAEVHPLEP